MQAIVIVPEDDAVAGYTADPPHPPATKRVRLDGGSDSAVDDVALQLKALQLAMTQQEEDTMQVEEDKVQLSSSLRQASEVTRNNCN